ncbi:fructosamine kinase family protein [Brevibacillus humidisoli]|uniref:fructosamine kinase family protein n=1 Tax=Brevibacillus humidisoli TaxID=2895522 RepID=UPI001E2D2F9C|nr:fructosamine kinase family protein [Brevibacillus humidisoli]UFJ40266.1 fructosamine kinase family protein [Brevibacillus humidisoli]
MRRQLTQTKLAQTLRTIGDTSAINEIRPVTGGDINEVYYVRTAEQEYCVKWNQNIPSGFFAKEAEGLERIRQSKTVAVPLVYGVHEDDHGRGGLLILEWIEGEKTSITDAQLGRSVAALHQTPGPGFGWETDTYIGRLPQKNGWYQRWTDYYRECRLLPQMKRAEQSGRMPVQRGKRLLHLMENIEKWLPKEGTPALLHGDLWGGNWLVGPYGRPYLIDPSAFYGHYEFELAFTELFGGFSDLFYQSYQQFQPLSPHYEERKPLYQLFYLLVHLNLFGESYGSSIDRILTRYVG